MLNANKESSELGGHIASYQSAATLYEVGFNHFWRAPTDDDAGDLVYMQGHSSPGIYARMFLEGRLTEERPARLPPGGLQGRARVLPAPVADARRVAVPDRLDGPRPADGDLPGALHEVPPGPQPRPRPPGARCGAFLGDGETDEPESLGSIALAGREKLDNLVFVVNCNLQRLDGPVRGNGKIIQELESDFRGAGWNVIKVIWGDRWDPLLARDDKGLLKARMMEAVDGEYQTYKSRNGAFVREHFFGTDPELLAMVEDLSDEQVWQLNRGGHDAQKVYAAYHAAATPRNGQPTVILAKTIKGYGMGASGEGQNIAHQAKKMDEKSLLFFRDRFGIELTDEQVHDVAFFKPPDDSREMVYLREQREALGGGLPQRRVVAEPLEVPDLQVFEGQLNGTGEREISTTMAFVRMLSALLRDDDLGPRIVPIVPDESRTFGMEGMFRQLGIFSQVGQLYQPQDRDQLMYYREDKGGQILQEGINEPGAFSSWLAAATSYANHGIAMVPFYIYYSMFGFQRVGDLAWAAGDSRARGFLLGGTAGRTTLNGEGLQHEDGHSHIQSVADPQLRLLRPDLQLRARGHRPGRPAAHVRRVRGRLLLPDGDERELRRTRRCRRARRRASCAGCTRCARPTARRSS